MQQSTETPVEISITAIARQIAVSRQVIAFTGAGISTESGIPDYRSQGGIWDQFQPVYFDDFMRSQAARIEYWRQKTELYHDLVKAQPNAAHHALVRLFQLQRLTAVITQNIDGLHQAAGLADDRVIELHGNTRRIRCLSCNAISSEDEAQKRIARGDLAPACACGGFLKPDTVSFGQPLPVDKIRRSHELAQTCDLCLVIGSTLLVQPAAGIPAIAKQNGAFLVIINLSRTPLDRLADICLRMKAGEALSQVATAVAEMI